MIEGTWSCLTCENDGRIVPEEIRLKLRLELTAKIYRTKAGEQLLFEGEYQVREHVEPKQIDILATSGPLQGQSALGIYELTDGELKLAYVLPGKPRPQAFSSVAGTGVANTTWRKAD